MVPHSGESSRTFGEIRDLGAELKALSAIAGSRVDSAVGIFVDYPSWWASEIPTSPTASRPYPDDLLLWYRGLRNRNIAVNMVSQEESLENYRLLFMPRLFLLTESFAERLEAWVAAGGLLVASSGSAWIDETGAVHSGGAPGPLRPMLSIRVEDVDPLPPGERFNVDFGDSVPLAASDWREVIISEGAETLAVYSGGPLDGRPALTVNRLGTGEARYVSFSPGAESLDRILEPVLRKAAIQPVFSPAEGIRATRRKGSDSRSWLFLMNETENEKTVALPERAYRRVRSGESLSGKIAMGAWGVEILEEL